MKLQSLMNNRAMRFTSQYPLLLAAVKAVSYVWAQKRVVDAASPAPASLYFLEAVGFRMCASEKL
jgi:hypothetical protein